MGVWVYVLYSISSVVIANLFESFQLNVDFDPMRLNNFVLMFLVLTLTDACGYKIITIATQKSTSPIFDYDIEITYYWYAPVAEVHQITHQIDDNQRHQRILPRQHSMNHCNCSFR